MAFRFATRHRGPSGLSPKVFGFDVKESNSLRHLSHDTLPAAAPPALLANGLRPGRPLLHGIFNEAVLAVFALRHSSVAGISLEICPESIVCSVS